MAHGLETRVPFLDNDLVDFAMRCPVNLKLNNLSTVLRINENDPGGMKGAKYFEKTKDGKQILRDVMGAYIPKHVTQAEKQGFSSPDASWFKGDSIQFVKKVVFDEQSLMYQFLERKTVIDMVSSHLSGQRNLRLLIWSLLNFEIWLREVEDVRR